MNKRRTIVIFLVLIIVILIEVFVLIRCAGGNRQTPAPEASAAALTPAPTSVPTPEPTSEPTAAPAPTAVPTPVPTEAPVQTPAETTEAPTPEPVPAPTAPAGDAIASGSFQSDTGTPLTLVVDWTSYTDGSGSTVVTVTGTLASYSISVGARAPGVTVSFGGQTVTFNTPSVTVEDGYAETRLFSGSVTVPQGTSGEMTVSYALRGSYSGVDLPTVDCSGTVNG